MLVSATGLFEHMKQRLFIASHLHRNWSTVLRMLSCRHESFASILLRNSK